MGINDKVEDGFELVRDVFKSNFEQNNECGSAVSVFLKGRKVVDLWGGYQDAEHQRPWTADTITTVFSATKGLSSACLAMAHSRGWLDYDATVASYWPDFAAGGKEGITVRQLLSHQAGLSALDVKLDNALMADKDRLAGFLARQEPKWEPGTRHGYHSFTLGFYQSELLKHVDPKRRRLRTFFQEEVAEPLGLTFHMGLPDDFPDNQIAPIQGFTKMQFIMAQLPNLAPQMLLGIMWPGSIVSKTLMNPKMNDPAEWDSPALRRIENASAAGMGTARALATIYGDLAWDGQRLGFTDATRAELARPAILPSGGDRDLIWHRGTRYHLGFMKSCELMELPNEQAYGMMGASCADGFADPKTGLGFGFVTNKMSLNSFAEPRRWNLVRAVYEVLGTA